jgi:hypothetical protein
MVLKSSYDRCTNGPQNEEVNIHARSILDGIVILINDYCENSIFNHHLDSNCLLQFARVRTVSTQPSMNEKYIRTGQKQNKTSNQTKN